MKQYITHGQVVHPGAPLKQLNGSCWKSGTQTSRFLRFIPMVSKCEMPLVHVCPCAPYGNICAIFLCLCFLCSNQKKGCSYTWCCWWCSALLISKLLWWRSLVHALIAASFILPLQSWRLDKMKPSIVEFSHFSFFKTLKKTKNMSC